MLAQVNLISITQPSAYLKAKGAKSAEDIISYCARVSNPGNQDKFDTAAKLLKYLVRNKHWSPFEQVDVAIEINTTRDIGRQILRHGKGFGFQEFCIAGDTLITTCQKGGKTKKVSIEQLYQRQQRGIKSDRLVRVYDRDSKRFKSVELKEVFDTGTKPVFKLTLENGKSIISTAEHKILSFDGFKRLGEITTGDFVACNGIPVYRDREWMIAAKANAVQSGTGLAGIAEQAGGMGISTVTKWLRHHKIQFTKTEIASYAKIWNKGLPRDQQPRFNKPASEQTRAKQRVSATRGTQSNLYSNGKWTTEAKPWRHYVASFCKGYHLTILSKQGFTCALTGEPITLKNSEVDHKLPVYSRPDLALDPSNLQVLSKRAHLEKTKCESQESRYTVKYSKVKSVEPVGDIQTYDLEVNYSEHNYIANGIVVHNSQRYAEVDVDSLVLRATRMQDHKNRQNSLASDDSNLDIAWGEWQNYVANASIRAYKWAIDMGIAKELARVVLPEGMTPSVMYMKGSVRSWIHYVSLREANGTQLEHQQIALACRAILEQELPFLSELDV